MIEGMNKKPLSLRYGLAALLAVLLAAVLLVPPVPAQAQAQGQAAAPAVQADKYPLDQKIPVDPRITVGRLPNGLRYWLRVNKEPNNRAELRLVVNAGSVLEDEDQRGLAHVVEHLAFNGSTHFPQQKLVDFMQSIGMRFGPDLNAFTGLDQTIYLLKIPTDSTEVLETSFLILEDWAQGVAFEPQAVEKEAKLSLGQDGERESPSPPAEWQWVWVSESLPHRRPGRIAAPARKGEPPACA